MWKILDILAWFFPDNTRHPTHISIFLLFVPRTDYGDIFLYSVPVLYVITTIQRIRERKTIDDCEITDEFRCAEVRTIRPLCFSLISFCSWHHNSFLHLFSTIANIILFSMIFKWIFLHVISYNDIYIDFSRFWCYYQFS